MCHKFWCDGKSKEICKIYEELNTALELESKGMFGCGTNIIDLAQPGEPNLTHWGEPIWLAHFIKEKLLCAEIKTTKKKIKIIAFFGHS